MLAVAAAAISIASVIPAIADDKPYDGVTLTLASQNDQFGTVMADLAPEFKEKTGITVKVDILSYPELLTKVTADFVGHTKGYDWSTMDNVWSGQFAEGGYTVDLTDWIKRDAAEIKVDDIYPVLMSSLGNYKGKQVAFPFAGYANVLAYRKDLYEAAGLKAPETMEDMVANAYKLTDPPKQLRLRRQRPEGPGGGAGLDAVQRPDRRLDPRQGRQAGAELRGQHQEPRRLQGAVRQDRPSRRRRLRLGRPRGELPPGAGRQDADLVGRRRRLRQSRDVEDGRQGRHHGRAARQGRAARNMASAAGGWRSTTTSTTKQKEAAWAVDQVADQPRRPQGVQPARRRQLSPHQRDPRLRAPGEISLPAGDRSRPSTTATANTARASRNTRRSRICSAPR